MTTKQATQITIDEIPAELDMQLATALRDRGSDVSACSGTDLPPWCMAEAGRITALLVSIARSTDGRLPASMVVATIAAELNAIREAADDSTPEYDELLDAAAKVNDREALLMLLAGGAEWCYFADAKGGRAQLRVADVLARKDSTPTENTQVAMFGEPDRAQQRARLALVPTEEPTP